MEQKQEELMKLCGKGYVRVDFNMKTLRMYVDGSLAYDGNGNFSVTKYGTESKCFFHVDNVEHITKAVILLSV